MADAKNYSAGKVYVQVLPTLDGWRKAVENELKARDVKAKVTVEPVFDVADFQRELNNKLRNLRAAVTVRVDADTAVADGKLAATERHVAALDGKTVGVQVDADTAAADAKLMATRKLAQSLNGYNATVTVNADDHGSTDLLGSRMQRLLALIVAGSGAIGGLGAGLVALGAGAVVGAAGLASVAVGATAIGAAMKAQTAATTQAGQTAAQEAQQRLSAANQVLNAQDALKAAITGVSEAQRNASNNVRSALDGQTRAEERLQVTQAAAVRAQLAITAARQDAARSIEDLQNKVIDDALDQRQAILDLEDAAKKLKTIQDNPAATERQRAEAQLAFEQAKQHLSEISLSYKRSQADSTEAAKAGVEGSKQVVAAQDAITVAQREYQNAQRSTVEAARAVTEARLDGAHQVAQSQQQVIQAQRALTQAEGASAVQAQHQGEAHRKFADALDKLAPGSLRFISYLRSQGGEWQALTKASQGFVPGLQAGMRELEPAFGALNDNVSTLSASAGEFFHVIGKGLVGAEPFFDTIAVSSQTLFPRFGESVNRAASAVGQLVMDMLPLVPAALDTVDAVSELVRTWSPFIAQASGPLLESLQEIIKNLDFLGPLLVAVAGPVGDLTSALVGGLREAFVQLTPELGPFLQSCVDLLAAVMPLVGAAGELAAVLAHDLVPVIDFTTVLLKPLVAAIGGLVHLFSILPTPITAAVLALGALRLISAPLERAFTKIGIAITGLGVMAGDAATKMGASATTAGRFATAGQRVGSALSKVGAAIPIVGAALIGIGEAFAYQGEQAQKAREATDKWGAALLAGGSQATAARAQITEMRRAADDFAARGGDIGQRMAGMLRQAADDIGRSAQRQADSMTGVELAQLRVTTAQRDYDKAVRDFGPTSAEAVNAHIRLTGAVDTSKRAQYDAAQATKSHTEKLQDQQDQIAAMADAGVAKDRAALQLQRAQGRIGASQTAKKRADQEAQAARAKLDATTRQFGKGSEQATQAQLDYTDALERADSATIDITEAQLDLTSAQSRYVATSGEAAAATAKVGGEWDTTAAQTHGANEALVGLLRTQGETLPAIMLSAIAHIDEADKKFLGLTTTVTATGDTILHLPGAPGQPPVEITFHDNVPQITENVDTLQTRLTDFDKFLRALLTPGPGTGPTSLAGLLGLVPVVSVPATAPKAGSKSALPGTLGNVLGRASGGPIPGTGNSDTYPAMLTPGEFVFSKPAVNNLGMANVAAMHHAARRGFAAGGPVGISTFASGGAVDSGVDTGTPLGWLAGLVQVGQQAVSILDPLTQALRQRLIPALTDTLVASANLANASTAHWALIAASVEDATTRITTGYVPALQTGFALVDQAIGRTAVVFASQWGAIRGYASDPVRAMLAGPFNAGLIPAWNLIDTTFNVGKPLAPLAIPFASGGRVPGTGNRDSVRAYLTPGEYVLSTPAIANLGGLANVDRLHQMARAGEIGPHQRLGRPGDGAARLRLMRTVPMDGLGFAYGGVQPHVAAAGAEIEAKFGALPGGIGGVGERANVSDHPLGLALDFMTMQDSALGNQIASYLMANAQRLLLKYLIWQQQINEGTGWSPMEDRGSITANHLDHVHASFLLAGQLGHAFAGAAPGFDLAGSFAATRDAVAAVTSAFPGNTIAAGAGAEVLAMIEAVVGWATSNLMAAPAAPGSGPVVDQVRGVAARYGWNEGLQWAALSTLISHESSWNPTAQNPVSTAFGLLQFLDSTWGATGIAKTSNPALQAEAGMRYIKGRYGDPQHAWDFWSRNHWYDDGGYLPPGLSLAYNGTGRPEPVLTGDQWNSMVGQGGTFTGSLYLDSGEFLGAVRGEIDAAHDATGRALTRRARL